jgi:hypothetical protein
MIVRDSEIINAVATRLDGLHIDSSTPVNIFKNRYVKLNDNEYPAINILLHEKTYTPTDDTAYNVAERLVELQLVIQGNDSTETLMGSTDEESSEVQIREQIEILEELVRNVFNRKNEVISGFNRRVKNFRLNRSSIQIDIADKIYGTCIMTYACNTIDAIGANV